MPVNSTHPDYDANVFAWGRARDVYAGEDAVKAAGTSYLPRLDSQSDEEYAAYKMRASFFNATARTADGLVGMVFRKEPTFKLAHLHGPVPHAHGAKAKALLRFVSNVDLLGSRLTAYAKDVVQEVILVGRAGTLVDWAGSTGEPGRLKPTR